MARVSPILTNFTSGEISPKLLGRVDLARYANAAQTIKNFIVLPFGGVTRRPGTRFIYEAKLAATKKVRLVPFIFNETQAYILEFGDEYIRFYYQQGILETGSPAAPLEIVSPYDHEQLQDLRFAQSADVIYISHPNVAPQKLSRTAHTTWTIGAVSFTAKPAEWTGTNYPGCVAFFEQRLWWAATPARPQTLWASVSGSYEDLTTGTADDDALEYTIASGRVNKIVWMEPHKRLLVGTLGETWTVGASSSLDPITPTNVRFERETTVGSANIQGRIVNNAMIHVGRHGAPVYEDTFDINLDSFKGVDISILAAHLFGDTLTELRSRSTTYGIKAWDYQAFPESLLWFITNENQLIGCTYNRNEEVVAWHQHDTEGTLQSIAVIPGPDFRDEVWLAVIRTTWDRSVTPNVGTNHVYIEMMEPGYVGNAEMNTFLDSSLEYSGAAADTLSGMDHLVGNTVQIWTSIGIHPDVIVAADGTVALDWEVTRARVGLGFTSALQTLPLEAGAQDGTAQGKKKRIHSVAVRFHNTLGGKIGSAYDLDGSGRVAEVMDDMLFRTTSDDMDGLPDLFTGDKVQPLRGGYNRPGELWIVQEQPLPMTILAIMPQATTNDQ